MGLWPADARRGCVGDEDLSGSRAQSLIMALVDAQMHPSVSRQMPSGPTPSAQTRRFDRVPSSAMSKAVSRAANDSATMRVLLSDVMTIPFGKAISVATSRAEPSAPTSAIFPGAFPLARTASKSAKSKLIVLT
jgi:hypothetical protein